MGGPSTPSGCTGVLNLNPSSGPVTTTHIQFAVSGLDPNQTLTIGSSNQGVPQSSIMPNVTDSTGSATGSFTFINNGPNTYTITASTPGGKCAQTTYIVTGSPPTSGCTGVLNVNPAAGPANTTQHIQFALGGLDPNQPLTIGSSNQGVPQSSVTPNSTNSTGGAVGFFDLNTGSTGTLTITASTPSGRCAQTTFTVV
jgi:hypothetical protein